MIFHGFQKMTLLDFPGHIACTLFTGGCNFRCPFCHNAVLVNDLDAAETYTEEDVFAFLEKRRALLDGVAISGGEPLLTDDIIPFIRRVRALGLAVKLDTNGAFPARLKAIVGEGLVDYVAMDIKNTPEKYGMTAGLPRFDFAPVRESIDFLLAGHVDYEFRTTVVAEYHTVEDIEKIARMIAHAPRYFLQNFTDSGNLLCKDVHGVPPEEMRRMRDAATRFLPATQLRGM